MWKRLSKTEWPQTGDHHWVRGGFDRFIARFEGAFMLAPGSSLRTKTQNDYDISDWEYYTPRIKDPNEQTVKNWME